MPDHRYPCSILVITNRESLGLSLSHAAQSIAGKHVPICSITYAETITLLTSQRIKETDFLILELLRAYPGGQRAEGIVLAERFLYRKAFLIVSPLHLAQQIHCPGYWDTEAEDALRERMLHICNFPAQCAEGFQALKECFSKMLVLPAQH